MRYPVRRSTPKFLGGQLAYRLEHLRSVLEDSSIDQRVRARTRHRSILIVLKAGVEMRPNGMSKDPLASQVKYVFFNVSK